jgi:hypothetical protein
VSWCDLLSIGIFSGSGSCGKQSETICTNIRRSLALWPGKSFAASPFAGQRHTARLVVAIPNPGALHPLHTKGGPTDDET